MKNANAIRSPPDPPPTRTTTINISDRPLHQRLVLSTAPLLFLLSRYVTPHHTTPHHTMSLSFVSSAVQVGTSDGGFEETPIENKETEAVNRRNAHKPLFEQLRSNQEEDQEKQEELQRQIMRSTCALDEDDVAHLDSIERHRSDRERTIRERTENELRNFRAARALKQQAALAGGSDSDDNDNDNNHNDNDNDDCAEFQSAATVAASGNNADAIGLGGTIAANPVETASRLPVIKVKKRKRRINPTDATSKDEDAEQRGASKQKTDSKSEAIAVDETGSDLNKTNTPSGNDDGQSQNEKKPDQSSSGLGSLLSGYGSSSDEED
eukprot:jgi/Psemu1/16674/gm1.16674_g